nr:hypothetical protein [uncultured Lelliottia sp.]
MTLTKEWLQQTIEEMEYDKATFPGDLNEDHGNVFEAMKMALAGMEAEPVSIPSHMTKISAPTIVNILANDEETPMANAARILAVEVNFWRKDPLYTSPVAPQPLTNSERAELENYLNAQQVDSDLFHMAASAIDDLLMSKDRSGAGVWADVPAKLRRAAMLQGAEPVTMAYKLPDGWVMVPAEPTDAMVEAMYKHQLSMRGALKAAIAAAPQQETE